MKKSHITIILLMVLVAVVGFGLYFKSNLVATYKDVEKNLQNFQKTNLGNVLTQIQKEISLPPPLHVGGPENAQILTKAKVIAQTNIQRFNNHLQVPLIENDKLSQAARIKAEDMFTKQYFDHISPSGEGPGELAKHVGYDYIMSGENLILGNFISEAAMVQAWMDSPGHRANILNERFTEIGVAVIKGTYKGQTVWIGVQEFGLPLASCLQPDETLKQQIDRDKSALEQLFVNLELKKKEIDQTDRKSSDYNQLVDEYNQMVKAYNDLAADIKSLISRYNIQVNAFNQCVEGEEPRGL